MTWALVPDNPKALTPAIAGVEDLGHSINSTGTVSGNSCHGILGFGSEKCRLGGMALCFKQRAVLISPAMPAAASVWPMLVFADPITQRLPSGRPSLSTSPSA